MQPSAEGNRRLDSWKAIADYLGRDVGTVRRWEKAQRLPIRRVPGGPGRSVFAFTEEIDAWLRDSEHKKDVGQQLAPSAWPPAPPVWRWSAAGALAVAALATAGLLAVTNRADDARITIQISELGIVARDLAGGERWRHRFPEDHRTLPGQVGRQWVARAGADPAAYVVTSHRLLRDQRVLGGELLAFDDRGAVRRRFSFDDEYRVRGASFGGPWAMATLAAEDGGRVAVAAHHYLWDPAVVTVLDRDFKRTGTFVHAGWIEALAWVRPDRLLIGGFQQARDGGMIGLLDPAAMNGQGPEEPGSQFYCEGCGADRPLKMVVMPRSELNVVTGSRFNRAVIEVLPDRLIARTVEIPEESPAQGAPDAIYEFTYDLDLIGATFGAQYWDKHRALEAAGKLNHSREHCPERFGPRHIFTWDRAGGWRTKTLQAVE
jgi:hypothetical protein